jgi:signal transduction histidine kinase
LRTLADKKRGYTAIFAIGGSAFGMNGMKFHLLNLDRKSYKTDSMRRALKIISPKQAGTSMKTDILADEHAATQGLAPPTISHDTQEDSTLSTMKELVHTISHYLNTPLTVLLGKVEILSEASENGGMSKEDLKKSLETCKREIFRIDAIVKSFQNLCQVQHKSYPPGVRMLDVEQEIKNRLKQISYLR